MTLDDKLVAIRDAIQHDPGHRGLAKDRGRNLITACADDFSSACKSIAANPYPRLGVITGFLIPTSDPPRAETDGPLGTLFLAHALHAMELPMLMATDRFCLAALHAGIAHADLTKCAAIPIDLLAQESPLGGLVHTLSHLIALERVGPSHTPESLRTQPNGWANDVSLFLRECPPSSFDRYHTMRGRDITDSMFPAHRIFEHHPENRPNPITIGIGDGGNEIGMGKIQWDIIRSNIPNGGKVACRTVTDHLIVCGVSNWGGYALAAGIALCRGQVLPATLFDPNREFEMLKILVETGDLVDGVTGKATPTVDGLNFDVYIEPLIKIRAIMEA